MDQSRICLKTWSIIVDVLGVIISEHHFERLRPTTKTDEVPLLVDELFPVMKRRYEKALIDLRPPSVRSSQSTVENSESESSKTFAQACPVDFPKPGAFSRVKCLLPDGMSFFFEGCSRAVDIAKAEHRLGDRRCFVCDLDITSQQHAPKHQKRRTKGSNPHGHFSPFQARIQANHSSSRLQPTNAHPVLGDKVLVALPWPHRPQFPARSCKHHPSKLHQPNKITPATCRHSLTRAPNTRHTQRDQHKWRSDSSHPSDAIRARSPE